MNYAVDREYMKPGSEVFYYTIVEYDCPSCAAKNGTLYCAEDGYLVDNVKCLGQYWKYRTKTDIEEWSCDKSVMKMKQKIDL